MWLIVFFISEYIQYLEGGHLRLFQGHEQREAIQT